MRELYKLIGKQGTIYSGGFAIAVEIQDVRQSFGRIDVSVSQVGQQNSTTKWVSLDKVVVNEDS